MKRELVPPLAALAYKIYSTPTYSLPEKASQFAACVAHIAASSHLPKQDADAFGCLAARSMLHLIQHAYQYSLEQAKNNFILERAKETHMKGRAPWIHGSVSLIPYQREHALRKASHLEQQSLSPTQHQMAVDTSNLIYPKAYCTAFLVFERASKTTSQKQFEQIILKELMENLADPFSYTAFFLQILKSREVSAILGILLFLGLVALAMPYLGVSLLPETTTFVMGTGMTSVGGTYHLWRFFSDNPKETADHPEKTLSPQFV